jgi:hypothetical protein
MSLEIKDDPDAKHHDLIQLTAYYGGVCAPINLSLGCFTAKRVIV